MKLVHLGPTMALCLLVACTGGSSSNSSAVTNPPNSTVVDLSSDLASAQDDLSVAESRVTELESQIARLEAQVDAMGEELTSSDSERQTLEGRIAELELEIEQLLLAYDDEIQALLADGESSVIDVICTDLVGDESERGLLDLIEFQIGTWEQQPGLPPGAGSSLDRSAIEEAVMRCHAEAAEQIRLATLREPKGDGFYTVNVEIASGTWESRGDADDCYWARLDADQDILDNHFGNAGGRITIRSSDTEVEFSGCGLWVFQG